MRREVRRALSRLAAYSWSDRLVLIRMAIDVVRIDLWLRHQGYRATYARTEIIHPLGRRIAVMPVDDVVRLVDAAARWTIGSEKSCLRRSLLTVWLLRSAGVRCDLVSGVGRGDTGWQGHAWVEVDGVPLRQIEDVHEQYSAFREQLSRRHEGAGTPSTNSPSDPSSR